MTTKCPEVQPALAFLGYLVALVVLVVQPRASPVILLVLTVFALAGNTIRKDAVQRWLGFDAVTVAFLAFCLWVAIACAWNPSPEQSLIKVALLVAVLAVSGLAVRSAARTSEAVAQAAIGALCVAFVFGALYLAFENLTGQLLLRTYYQYSPDARMSDTKHVIVDAQNNVIAVSDIFVNRGVLVWTLFVPAVWLGAGRLQSQSLCYGFRAACAAFIAMTLLASTHESSKLAIFLGLAALALVRFAVRRASVAIGAGWILACLLVVPIVEVANWAGWQHAKWLQDSARARVGIWVHTAKKIAERPIFGHGTHATPTLNSEEHKKLMDAVKAGDPTTRAARTEAVYQRYMYGERLAPHAHNVYLQTWFELGAIGAVLLAVFGLAILRQIHRLPPPSSASLFVLFAMVAAGLATSYGFWQLWLQAAIGLATTMTAIAVRVETTTSLNLASCRRELLDGESK